MVDLTVTRVIPRRLKAALDILEASRTAGRRERPLPGRGRAHEVLAAPNDRALRLMIWDIAGCFPVYGYRKVAAELRRRGMPVGLKKVRRLMREEGLCAIVAGRRGWGCAGVGGRVGDHDGGRDGGRVGNRDGCGDGPGPGIPNLLPGLDMRRPDQAWAVDVTCIRLEREFIFLAAVIDLFSRRCLGWSLGRHFHLGHVLRALRKAFGARAGKDLSGLIVHSDRGIACASREYRSLLESRGIFASASRPGCPGDNARIERFFGTLKYEDLRLGGYRDFGEALDNIRDFIEEIYNKKRLHSALGYKTPEQFECLLATAPAEEAGA